MICRQSIPEVSIICNAYNHGNYIRDALEGFVRQKTQFPFEILVHDDASTDDTADIILEYARKYPHLVFPVFQKQNQYSNGIPISSTFQYPRAKGRYLAFCEGDDYWTDPFKLQRQYDALEAHPESDMCACASLRVSAIDGSVISHKRILEMDGLLTAKAVIWGGGGFVDTASLFFRRILIENIPPFRKLMPFDYTLQVHGSLRGGLYYLADEMCVYRVGVPDSATQRIFGKLDKRIAHYQRVDKMLSQMNRDTGGKYRWVILGARLRNLRRQVVFRIRRSRGRLTGIKT